MHAISFKIIFLLLAVVLSGCAPSYIRTTLKAEHVFHGKYNKILVVGIIKNDKLLLRRQIARQFFTLKFVKQRIYLIIFWKDFFHSF
jgi:hypothetical protein